MLGTSSNKSVSFVVVAVVLLIAAPVAAQGGQVDPEARDEAIAAYNTATRVELEGYEGRHGGPGTVYLERALDECVGHALRSFRSMPSLLASWRMASCASGLERHVTAWLAFLAFDQIEAGGLASWESESIETDDRLRVLAAYARREQLVGGVRLGPVAEGYRVDWPHATPVRVLAGELPDSNSQIVLVDGVYYGPAGTTQSILVQGEGESRRVEIRFAALSSGIQDIALMEQEEPEPIVEAPVVAAVPLAVEEPIVEEPPKEPAKPSVTEAPADEDGGVGLAVAGWVSLAVGVIGVGTGALLWTAADSIQQDLDAACPSRMGCDPALESDYDRGRNLTLGGNIAVIGGSVLAALGVVLLVVDFTSGSETDVTLQASATSVELLIGGDL